MRGSGDCPLGGFPPIGKTRFSLGLDFSRRIANKGRENVKRASRNDDSDTENATMIGLRRRVRCTVNRRDGLRVRRLLITRKTDLAAAPLAKRASRTRVSLFSFFPFFFFFTRKRTELGSSAHLHGRVRGDRSTRAKSGKLSRHAQASQVEVECESDG